MLEDAVHGPSQTLRHEHGKGTKKQEPSIRKHNTDCSSAPPAPPELCQQQLWGPSQLILKDTTCVTALNQNRIGCTAPPQHNTGSAADIALFGNSLNSFTIRGVQSALATKLIQLIWAASDPAGMQYYQRPSQYCHVTHTVCNSCTVLRPPLLTILLLPRPDIA